MWSLLGGSRDALDPQLLRRYAGELPLYQGTYKGFHGPADGLIALVHQFGFQMAFMAFVQSRWDALRELYRACAPHLTYHNDLKGTAADVGLPTIFPSSGTTRSHEMVNRCGVAGLQYALGTNTVLDYCRNKALVKINMAKKISYEEN